jgi:hypothetical protein
MTSMACRYGSSPSETAFNSMKMKMLINWSFQLKFQYAVQNIEIYDNFETSEKEKLM